MWCIPTITPEFIERMEAVLALYEKPYNSPEPVICFDEKSKQLLRDTRPIQLPKEGKALRYDYEYKRNGTRNIFCAVEPLAGTRTVSVTRRRTRNDFALFIKNLAEGPYKNAETLHIVLDNLNTHNEQSFRETFGETITEELMRRIRFHYTPKHASWLNMAEIELSILGRQCVNRRIPTEACLRGSIAAWQKRRNRHRMKINWKFTRKDARTTFKYESTVWRQN